jgi:2-dehydropantoate 2-reductase
MKAAILGVGSLGTVLGASITHNGGEVTLIDSNKEHVEAMKKNGITIDGLLDLKNVPVHAIQPEQMEGKYDLVVVMLKQTANEVALTNLLKYLHNDSIVLTLQNGLPEESVARIIGESRTLSGTVQWPAYWTGPGKSRLGGDKSMFNVEISTINGKDSLMLKKMADFLRVGLDVKVNLNLSEIRWTKLLINASGSGISAATGSKLGAM